MIRILLIALILTGCATLDPQSQAVVSMTKRGYDMTEIDLFTTVITVDNIKGMPIRSGGYCDPETHYIYFVKTADYDKQWHEWMHLYLLRSGVDISKHHKIMGKRM